MDRTPRPSRWLIGVAYDPRPGWLRPCRQGHQGKIVRKKDGTPQYVYEKTIHDFRRTAARNLARAGVRRDVAKAITGHKTDIIYSRYNVNDEHDLRDAVEQVTAYVAALPTQSESQN